MTLLRSRVPGQTPLGLFTNLWPTRINRLDRRTLGGWYVALHVGRHRFEILS